jgi:hypothetical protein
VGIKVGLAGLDGGKDRLKRVTTLFHITLDLPVQFDLVGDVEVERKVEKVTHAGVVHGVKTLDDDDRSRLDGLGCVKGTVNVVVNWLGDAFSFLEFLQLLVHEVEVVLKRVEGSEATDFAAIAVVEMVIIKAQNGREVRHKTVGFPSAWGSKSATKGANCGK